MTLGVGVIGTGVMGRRHAENLASLWPRARLVAVADVTAAAAEATGKALDCDWYIDPLELLARDDLTAVVISSAADTHASLVLAAAEHGKDILCEKPLALTIADARSAVVAAEHAGVRLQIGFMRRYDPAYRQAYDAIQRGEIGRPVMFNAISRDAHPPPRASFTTFSAPGARDLFVESGIHDFDLARWMMGDEVVRVSAEGAILTSTDLADVQPIDAGIATLTYRGGAMGTVQLYRNAVYGYDIRTEIVGSKGTVQVGDHHWHAVQIRRDNGIVHTMQQHWLERFAEAYALEVADWVRRMETGEPSAVTGEDGVLSMALALAAERARVSGHPVDLDAR